MNGLPCKTYSLHTPIPGSESPARQMMGLRASFDFLPLQEYQMGGLFRCVYSGCVSQRNGGALSAAEPAGLLYLPERSEKMQAVR